MPKRGLPNSVRMRHDEHYVEALTSSAGSPIGRLVPIDQVDANPNQPRQVMGDLSELMASIAEKGIIEPIIVRQRGPRFQIVAGERRYQAAVQVGIPEIPVVIREVDDAADRLTGRRGELFDVVLVVPHPKRFRQSALRHARLPPHRDCSSRSRRSTRART